MPVRRAHISFVSKPSGFFCPPVAWDNFGRPAAEFATIYHFANPATPGSNRKANRLPFCATIAKILTSRFETIHHFANGLPGCASQAFPPPVE